ncbi:MAG: type II toxin-antitoxin system RelE/ParE family toxin [Balneolaceae bacterium]|nr:type II toxin-antitoxin system RelE/ParE family toxin [Balneolaceae bacterium]
MKKVIWTPTARKSLQETTNFIKELWNEQVADEFLNQLDYRIEQIQRNPNLAPTFKNSEFRQLLVHKSVSLFYKNYPEHLKLLLVWDNRQDPVQLLKKITGLNKE